jgi:hypothetical protein
MSEPKDRAARYRVGGLKVIYDTGNEFWAAPVINASESGLFVETHHELAIGSQVTILPDVPHDEQLPFELGAEVARVNEYDPDNHFARVPGMAFRLVGLSSDQLAQVRIFLRQHGVKLK